MVNPLEGPFPNLAQGGCRVTSPPSKDYNGIAWAAGDTQHWWWPDPADWNEGFWPEGTAREESLAAFQGAFAVLGYIACSNDELESGYEKITLFGKQDGLALHAARQQPSGLWSSKMGELEDIEHALRDLEGPEYGTVAMVMKRAVQV